MLIDEHYPNVLSLFRELVECLFYRVFLRLVVDHKEVPLRVRWLCDMSNTCQEQPSDRTGRRQILIAWPVFEELVEVYRVRTG